MASSTIGILFDTFIPKKNGFFDNRKGYFIKKITIKLSD